MRALTLRIGDVSFRVRSELPLWWGDGGLGAYAAFVSEGIEDHPEGLVVDVEVSVGKLPVTDYLPMVFDGGGAWRLYADQDEYVFQSVISGSGGYA